ncbi:MAG TPA: hypothetical protein VII06_27175 [Chloroflexota bacterium]|jgi:hypothetical protein
MGTALSHVFARTAQALYALLGPPPLAARAPAPAVVLVTTHARPYQERAALYRQRYSRYLAATEG